ncbi:hypothetical protein AAHA92_13879 [Salvia divinorum]|uniref:Myb-like domain-containing protein n=1 Tax=Salvia divinorum TaxID=28513 RepID=A0ABD1H9Q9_SALDI
MMVATGRESKMADYRRGKAIMEASLAAHETSNVPGHKQPKGERSRRMWSDREEEVLLAAFKELVVQGWKSGNGFRDHKIDCDDEQWAQIMKADPNTKTIRQGSSIEMRLPPDRTARRTRASLG